MKKAISLEELPQTAKDFLGDLTYNSRAVIVGLCGDLGSGKTTFVKEVAKQLGIEGEITSPTFTVMQKYEIRNTKSEIPKFQTLVHVDLYRFDEPDELKVLRLEEIFADPKNLVLIEWADKFFKRKAKSKRGEVNFIKIKFKHVGREDKREIEIIYE